MYAPGPRCIKLTITLLSMVITMTTRHYHQSASLYGSPGGGGGGGGGSLAHKLATHLRPPTSKMNPKWRIAPCYNCTLNGVTLAKHNPKWYPKMSLWITCLTFLLLGTPKVRCKMKKTPLFSGKRWWRQCLKKMPFRCFFWTRVRSQSCGQTCSQSCGFNFNISFKDEDKFLSRFKRANMNHMINILLFHLTLHHKKLLYNGSRESRL